MTMVAEALDGEVDVGRGMRTTAPSDEDDDAYADDGVGGASDGEDDAYEDDVEDGRG